MEGRCSVQLVRVKRKTRERTEIGALRDTAAEEDALVPDRTFQTKHLRSCCCGSDSPPSVLRPRANPRRAHHCSRLVGAFSNHKFALLLISHPESHLARKQRPIIGERRCRAGRKPEPHEQRFWDSCARFSTSSAATCASLGLDSGSWREHRRVVFLPALKMQLLPTLGHQATG